jgi:membrane-associated HD superfamily phosphohydrolase
VHRQYNEDLFESSKMTFGEHLEELRRRVGVRPEKVTVIPNAVDPARFRHAGPKPQSREAAILMLADGVEASVRALDTKDADSIRGMVDRIVDGRVEDGQLDDAELTLRDIARIKEAFIGQLLGMYHSRIKYPDNVVPIEPRREQA